MLLGDKSHFQTFGAFTKKPNKKGSQRCSSWFSCTFCPDFVDLYNMPGVKKVYWSWLRVQNKFHRKLPNEGCMRMFSLFSSFKTVGLIGAFYGPSLRPLPIFATLLTYEISKFIIYMSLSIPEYSSLHPGLFKWIWIPTFAIISFHPSPSTTLTKDPGSTPYNGLYGEAPPERGIFFRLQVYERVGISLVEVCKRGSEICHLGLWKG